MLVFNIYNNITITSVSAKDDFIVRVCSSDVRKKTHCYVVQFRLASFLSLRLHNVSLLNHAKIKTTDGSRCKEIQNLFDH